MNIFLLCFLVFPLELAGTETMSTMVTGEGPPADWWHSLRWRGCHEAALINDWKTTTCREVRELRTVQPIVLRKMKVSMSPLSAQLCYNFLQLLYFQWWPCQCCTVLAGMNLSDCVKLILVCKPIVSQSVQSVEYRGVRSVTSSARSLLIFSTPSPVSCISYSTVHSPLTYWETQDSTDSCSFSFISSVMMHYYDCHCIELVWSNVISWEPLLYTSERKYLGT